MIVDVHFKWSDEHGTCYDCGLPAAYQIVQFLYCSVCTAQHAADGEKLIRLFVEPIPQTELYFECHITVAPMITYNLKIDADEAARFLDFRPATFLLKKEDPIPDDFYSARDTDYDKLHDRMLKLIDRLRRLGIKVKRYKIENTLLDVKL